MKKSFDDVIEEIFQLFDKSRPKVIHHKTRYIKQIGMRTKQREVLTRSEVNKYLYRLDSERKRKEKEKDKWLEGGVLSAPTPSNTMKDN